MLRGMRHVAANVSLAVRIALSQSKMLILMPRTRQNRPGGIQVYMKRRAEGPFAVYFVC